MIRDDWLRRYDDTPKTLSQAKTSLHALDEFINFNYNGIESLFIDHLKEDTFRKYIILDSLIQFWKSNKSPVTMRNYFSFIRSYLNMYEIETIDSKVKTLIKFPKQHKEKRLPLEKDKINEIITISDSKYQTFWYGLAASGMRVSEFTNAKTSWFDMAFYEKTGHLLINIPAAYTKEKMERFTLFTKQATLSLLPYLKNRINEGKVLDITYNAAKEYMRWVRERLEYTEKYQSGFHKLNIHSFRSFCRTALSDNCGSEFALFLLGEWGYLPNYYRKSPDESLKLYLLAETKLTL